MPENGLRSSEDHETARAGSEPVVLAVDDSEDAHDFYQSFLPDDGFRVVSALSAREAHGHLVKGARADVLLLDIMMPEMDGMELLGELWSDPRFAALPVVIASAVSVPATLRVPDAEYVTKPVRPEDLLRALRRALEKT